MRSAGDEKICKIANHRSLSRPAQSNIPNADDRNRRSDKRKGGKVALVNANPRFVKVGEETGKKGRDSLKFWDHQGVVKNL
jgi:hypothetical protein